MKLPLVTQGVPEEYLIPYLYALCRQWASYKRSHLTRKRGTKLVLELSDQWFLGSGRHSGHPQLTGHGWYGWQTCLGLLWAKAVCAITYLFCHAQINASGQRNVRKSHLTFSGRLWWFNGISSACWVWDPEGQVWGHYFMLVLFCW